MAARWLVVLAVVAGCGRIGFDPIGGAAGRACTYAGNSYSSGTTFAAGDGCNACACSDGAVTCSTSPCADACATCADASSMSCAPSGGCPNGPECGGAGLCCGHGEACVGGVCMCGTGAACTGTLRCEPGAGTPPPPPCGRICCPGPCT